MTVDLVSGNTAPLSTSTTSNWVARHGGLPGRVRAIARALMRRGMPESVAIATAINTVKRTAATGRVFGGKAKATATTRAAHTAAAGRWEALKASAHSLDTPGIDLAATYAMGSSSDGPRMVINAAARKSLAKRKLALADGSFPMPDKAHVTQAARMVNRTPGFKKPMVKALIRKRAKALGMTTPKVAAK